MCDTSFQRLSITPSAEQTLCGPIIKNIIPKTDRTNSTQKQESQHTAALYHARYLNKCDVNNSEIAKSKGIPKPYKELYTKQDENVNMDTNFSSNSLVKRRIGNLSVKDIDYVKRQLPENTLNTSDGVLQSFWNRLLNNEDPTIDGSENTCIVPSAGVCNLMSLPNEKAACPRHIDVYTKRTTSPPSQHTKRNVKSCRRTKQIKKIQLNRTRQIADNNNNNNRIDLLPNMPKKSGNLAILPCVPENDYTVVSSSSTGGPCSVTESTVKSETQKYLDMYTAGMDILIYSPDNPLFASALRPDGVFHISEKYLSKFIGKRLAEKFMKYYLGRRSFNKHSNVYYKPPAVLDTADSASSEDELECVGLYGQIYAMTYFHR